MIFYFYWGFIVTIKVIERGRDVILIGFIVFIVLNMKYVLMHNEFLRKFAFLGRSGFFREIVIYVAIFVTELLQYLNNVI